MDYNGDWGYTPIAVANWFLSNIDRDAGDSITHLKLQKLVYYAQAWSLAVFKKSLFLDDFQAWAHGPVLPVLYDEYKNYGYENIPAKEFEQNFDKDVVELFVEVSAIYGEKTAKYLEELTHNEQPWKNARAGISPELRSTSVISKESMADYYSNLLQAA